MTTDTQSLPVLLTRSQVAEHCGVTPRTVDNWRREGKLEPVRLTKRSIRFPATEVLALIDRGREAA